MAARGGSGVCLVLSAPGVGAFPRLLNGTSGLEQPLESQLTALQNAILKLSSTPCSHRGRRRMCWVRCSQTWWGRNFWGRHGIKGRLIEGRELQRDRGKKKERKRMMMCIKAKHSHIIVIITSGAIVPHMDSTQTAQKGWLKLLIAAPPDISDDSLLLLISLLFSGWSHWWGEAAMPRGKNYTPSLLPACLLTEDPALGVAPADTTASMTGGWSAQSVGNPVLPPRLSYRRVLLLTPVLCHLRGPQISCRLVPLSPLHTNSFSLSLLVSLSLSLSGASWRTQLSAPTGHGTVDMRRGARGEMTSAFPLPVFPGALYSPGSEAPLVLCVPLPEWGSPDLTLLI